jgi:putative ABC transport system substrate-binding protein
LLAAGARAGAKAIGAKIEFLGYEPIQELEPKLQRLVEAGVDGAGAFVPSVPEGRTLAALLIKLRLPSVGPPQAGFLVGCNASLPEAARIAAKHIDEILKGARPSDLPVEQVSTFFVGINLRTAKALGLSIPSSLLLQATTLIE